jgi:signal transduction histidine kinase
MIAARPKVLAIDDTPANLLTLGACMSDHFEMFMSTSGAEGLSLAAQHQPDLILLDVMMPGMNGFDVCKLLKADTALQNIPVVMITALNDVESEERGLALGAADFISKPFDVRTTLQRVSNLIEREQLRRANAEHQLHLEALVLDRTRDLQTAKELAEAANKAKNALLRNLGHEFRTPINAITGMLDLARYRSTDPEQRKHLVTASTAAHELLTMLNNLLDLSDLESKHLDISPQNFELRQVLGHIHTLLWEPAIQKGLTLDFQIDADLAQRTLVGDALRLGQVLSHLVDNAVRFTDTGGVTVTVSVQRVHEDSMALLFSIRDTGPGIAESDQERIFLPFEQVDTSHTRRHMGAGLGLALSRNLVALMGGHLWVHSQPGLGATFEFSLRLPFPQSNASAIPADEPGARRIAASQSLREHHAGKRVLLIESENVTRELIRHLLELADMRVQAVVTLDDALALTPGQPFHLALMAVDTPDLGSLLVPGTFSTRPNGMQDVPLIGMGFSALITTGSGWPKSDMRYYLEKPIHAQQLYETVLRALQH